MRRFAVRSQGADPESLALAAGLEACTDPFSLLPGVKAIDQRGVALAVLAPEQILGAAVTSGHRASG